MKAALEEKYADVEVKLFESRGGVFEVKKDDVLIFSKKELGRFPEHEEIFSSLE